MKTKLRLLICACLFVSIGVNAQDKNEKDRGNTDYTNNRSSAEDKQNDVEVNTEHETPVKIIEYIPGTWTLEQVMRGQKDVSEQDGGAQNERIKFNSEGRYMSYSGNEMLDSGAYRINEQHAILYLQSETGEQVNEWNVSFGEDGSMKMTLRDGASMHGERFMYVYKRASEE